MNYLNLNLNFSCCLAVLHLAFSELISDRSLVKGSNITLTYAQNDYVNFLPKQIHTIHSKYFLKWELGSRVPSKSEFLGFRPGFNTNYFVWSWASHLPFLVLRFIWTMRYSTRKFLSFFFSLIICFLILQKQILTLILSK